MECTFHQISPYIGKLKSTIARSLLETYSKRGDLVVDPFCGSGTIPLEAAILGRKVFASDASVYSGVLSRAKLYAPPSEQAALDKASRLLKKASSLPKPDLRRTPRWVRAFFHPRTLQETLRLSFYLRERREYFYLACLLGILHHQRPGFLSFPSSHLVPYLRLRKFPRAKFPQLYDYRDLAPRLEAKIKRTYKRPVDTTRFSRSIFQLSTVENLTFPSRFDCLITSPPYMNALDYGRDNRLRLWFIDPLSARLLDYPTTRQLAAFERAMHKVALAIYRHLSPKGYAIFVVGDKVKRSFKGRPSLVVHRLLRKHAGPLQLKSVVADRIPDIRRARRGLSGTKAEHILIYQKR